MTTNTCRHPHESVEPYDKYSYICRACGTKTSPWDPATIAKAIGPRRPGFVYKDYHWRAEVTVLEVRPYTFGWMAWSITETDNAGPKAGIRRTHCTAWNPRNTPLTVTATDLEALQ